MKMEQPLTAHRRHVAELTVEAGSPSSAARFICQIKD